MTSDQQKYTYTSEDIHKRKDNDAYFRINYLYQASLLFEENQQLSQFFRKQLTKVAEKVPIRMTPQLKQTHCKKCQTSLLDANITFKKTCKKLFTVKTCTKCGFKRKIFIKKLK